MIFSYHFLPISMLEEPDFTKYDYVTDGISSGNRSLAGDA